MYYTNIIMMKNYQFLGFILLFFNTLSVFSQKLNTNDSLAISYLEKAYSYSYYSPNFQKYLDSAISIKPQEPYFWQQKSMPFFKQRKYEKGMSYLNRAVELDTTGEYLEYRAFIKCIFQKNYQSSLDDFFKSKEKYMNGYVMDSYNFYISLSYLQLGDLEQAEKYILNSIEYEEKSFGKNGVNYLDLFYYAIILMEKERYNEALIILQQVVGFYNKFSDAMYYIGFCHYHLGYYKTSLEYFNLSKKFLKEGYSFTEANSIYEPYPYQIYMHNIDAFISRLNNFGYK